MRDRTPADRCPFCLDFLALKPGSKTKYRTTCGDEVCVRAYNRTYQRDRRRGLRVADQRVGSEARGGRGSVHGAFWFKNGGSK